MERVQKLLARAGVASRRESERLIAAGRVTVDGQTISLGDQADPDRQTICVDGVPIQLSPVRNYLALHKPAGVLSTRRDPQGRATVMDLIPEELRRQVYPVGRLDYDAEGLLLLLDDGELAHVVMHPRFETPKTYHALVAGKVEPETLAHLRRGVLLEDGITAPARVRALERHEGHSVLELTIHEGRKHQVKRMCEAVGHPVRRLQRVAMAGIKLGELKAGQWRRLSEREIEILQRTVRGEAAP